jgi:hypothetical protein
MEQRARILGIHAQNASGKSLPMNSNQERNLLTPALSSTSVWRRGRCNGARGFWGSMREILRRILSPLARGKRTENFLSAEYMQEIEMRPPKNEMQSSNWELTPLEPLATS